MILNEPISNTLKTIKEVIAPIKKIDSQNSRSHNDAKNSSTTPSASHDYFFVRNGGRYERIEVNNILFIKASGSYSQIITKDSSFTLAINMKSILAQISSETIVKCHRSFAVNIDCVKAFDDISIFITNKEKQYEIPLSVNYRKGLHEKLPRLKTGI